MPRSERPLDDGDGPLLRFAADLRKLREQAGSPVYRELSRRAHYSTAVLSEAAGGRKLPSLAVTLAYVTACDGDTELWEQRWREVSAELTPVETPQPDGSPYLGAAAFDVGDADRFFGRETLVEDLMAAVGEHRLVCVHGSSGSGKSSLLRAGLAAGDRRRGVVFTPGPHPIEECAVRLAVVAGWSAPRLRDELAADPGNLHLRIRQAAADEELLLVVDQFEEVFTACVDETERATFITALTHAAKADTSRCRVVLGVRADFLDRCHEEPALRDAHLFALRSMTVDELREAATRPALAAGLTLETALVARVIADASSGFGTLPLVSQALQETWHRRQGMTLTLAAYDEAGGVRHAIARTAESVYLGLQPVERDTARQIFLRLTAFGDGAEDTKRRVGRRELDNDRHTAAVLAVLVQARLVVVGRHDLELTHEALLVTWPRLREWLSEDRDGLRTHRQLTEAAAAWIALDRDSGALYRGLRLLIAEDWVNRSKPVLSARERMFFTASVYAEHSRERFDRKRTRRLRQLVAMLVVLLMVTAFVGVEAFLSSRRQFQEQAVQNVVGQMPTLARTNPYLAALLALAAHRLDPESPQATGRLLQFAVQQYGVPSSTRAVAVDTNADLIAAGTTDGTIALTDLKHGAGTSAPGFGVAVDSLAVSADSKLIAAAYVDGTLVVWDMSDLYRPVQAWTRHGDRVLVSFSRTGRTLAAGGHPVDGDRRLAPVASDTALWDVTDPYAVRSVGTLPQTLGPVQFSADGRTLTTVSSRGDVSQPQVWRQASGRWTPLATTTPDQDGDFVAESISADGSLVGAVTSDLRKPVATFWSVRADKVAVVDMVSTTPLPVPIAFDPSTGRAAGVNADGMVVVWHLDPASHNASEVLELDATTQQHLRSVFFTPDGRLVMIGDESVAVWTTDAGRAAQAVCQLPRTGLITPSKWDNYFTGMDVPMPCDN
ncbi:WD40 repeat domain-containing protein [Kutzneria sp. CA-103260]|uniref:WD40 repeat domain-containing protein n=1 Tax=Kutzneria sp. CA-103260 TaxID=2802641 RepID=UPI001BA44A21|nr:AAA family ATPase [Kutzneria sp. CA-103260]QUQ72589.1 AAA ATPase domain protein [Kutzneria sp. CA-103260]